MNEEALDTSYLEPLPVSNPEQQIAELEMLRELANKIGLYNYEYKDEYKEEEGANAGENIGIMAQDLQKIPGLSSSVIQAPDGSLSVDGNRLALAALGYVAALSRHILGITKGEENNGYEELSNSVSDQTNGTEIGVEGTTEGTANGAITEEGNNSEGSANETANNSNIGTVTTTSSTGLGDNVYGF